jgi:hypothetical protein
MFNATQTLKEIVMERTALFLGDVRPNGFRLVACRQYGELSFLADFNAKDTERLISWAKSLGMPVLDAPAA